MAFIKGIPLAQVTDEVLVRWTGVYVGLALPDLNMRSVGTLALQLSSLIRSRIDSGESCGEGMLLPEGRIATRLGFSVTVESNFLGGEFKAIKVFVLLLIVGSMPMDLAEQRRNRAEARRLHFHMREAGIPVRIEWGLYRPHRLPWIGFVADYLNGRDMEGDREAK